MVFKNPWLLIFFKNRVINHFIKLKTKTNMIKKINYLSPLLIVVIIAASFFITSCNQPAPATEKTEKKGTVEEVAKP